MPMGQKANEKRKLCPWGTVWRMFLEEEKLELKASWWTGPWMSFPAIVTAF